jgi:hypothetical protein
VATGNHPRHRTEPKATREDHAHLTDGANPSRFYVADAALQVHAGR